MYLNRVTLIGYLSMDPETRATRDGNDYVVLMLVTKRSWRDASGAWQSRSDCHRCTVWGKKPSAFASGLKKGAYVQIEGELRSREYEKDGIAHHVVEIRAESILRVHSAWGQGTSNPQDAEADEPL